MKIKDLELLFKQHTGGFYSGLNYSNFGIMSWGDWILEGIVGNKLSLKIKKGIIGEGQKSEVNFRKDTYDKLTDEQKKKINTIFINNIGKPVRKILEIDFI